MTRIFILDEINEENVRYGKTTPPPPLPPPPPTNYICQLRLYISNYKHKKLCLFKLCYFIQHIWEQTSLNAEENYTRKINPGGFD